MADVPGYERVPGSARRYRNTATGETISRRQHDNLRIQAGSSPFKNRAQIEKYRSGRNLEAQRHRRIARARDRMSPTPKGVNPADYDSEYVRLYVAMQNDPKNTSPTGPTAEFLAYIGLRDPSDQWDVGETP